MKLRTFILTLFLLPSIAWADTVGSFPTLANGKYTLADGTTYKLTENFNPSGYIEIPSSATVTIDLNGCTINRNLTSPTSWGIVIYNQGSLTIKDTSDGTNGKIMGGYNSGPGSGIYNKSGTLTIEGGIITGNYAPYNNSSNRGYGGGIYIEAGTLNLYGGSITENRAEENGGGIYLNTGATLNVKGAPTIINNTLNNSSANNLYLQTGQLVNIVDGDLTGSAGTIGISMQTPGVFTKGLNSDAAFSKFFSDNNTYESANNNSTEAQLQSCWMGVVREFEAGRDVMLDAQKVYKAVNSDPCITVPSDKSVTLNLNGQTLDRNLSSAKEDGCAIKNLGTLSISGSGIISGGRNSSGGGGIHNTGTLSISDATVRANTSTNLGGGIHNAGTMTISGGTIENNTASNTHGGGIYNSGTLNIGGGTITSNSANGTNRDGGGIYNSGILNISGGTIQTNTATRNGAGIYHNNTSANSFNVHGSPLISLNSVSSKANNVYLGTGSLITVDGTLTNSTAIGIIMETLGVFTSGLSSPGSATSANFTSDINDSAKLIDSGGEAMLQSYWSYLNSLLVADGSYALEEGKIYKAGSAEPYLHVRPGVTFTIYLDGNTLDRNLSEAIADGCVIYNEGTLTITKNVGKGTGTIKGGNNNDAGSLKGGGICNAGTLNILDGTTISNNTTYSTGSGIYNTGMLSIQGGSIQSNIVTTADGGGIYHNGATFSLQGGPSITNNKSNNVPRNVYLASGMTITITGTLSNSTAIGIASADECLVFTSGLSTHEGVASKFAANQEGKGIGLNSSGEAIIGPMITITRDINITNTNYAKLYIKGDYSTAQTAVYGERVKVKVWTNNGYIPVSVKRTTDIDFDSYPESGVDYEFDMPNSEVTISAICRQGGYCGNSTEKDVKYALVDGILTFIPKDASNYQMKDYEMGSAPWKNYNYTNVSIPKNLIGISAYAFCDNTKHLTAITVNGDNPNFKDVNGILFNKDGTTLICYPSGKTDLTSYTIPSGVTAINDGAFAFNSTLQSFTVAGGTNFKAVNDVLYSYNGQILVCYPAARTEETYAIAATVTEVKPYTFQSCSALEHVYVFPTTIPTGGKAMFDGTTCKIMVLPSLLDDYKTALYWKDYSNRIFAIDGTMLEVTLTSDLDSYDYIGGGSLVKPDVVQVRSLAGDNYTLVKGTDYSATYTYTNDDAERTGTVTITGLGNYIGINPSKDFYITRKVVISDVSGRYSTYYNSDNVPLEKPSQRTIYTVTNVNWENGSTELTELPYIPANSPVLLYTSGNSNGTFHLKKQADPSEVSEPVDFAGVSSDTDYSTLMVGKNAIYILKGDQFYRASSGVLKANRCYLAMPSSSTPAPSRVMFGDGEDGATGIDGPDVVSEDQRDWYSLDGRKLLGRPTQKGVYISNGKKVVIH